MIVPLAGQYLVNGRISEVRFIPKWEMLIVRFEGQTAVYQLFYNNSIKLDGKPISFAHLLMHLFSDAIQLRFLVMDKSSYVAVDGAEFETDANKAPVKHHEPVLGEVKL